MRLWNHIDKICPKSPISSCVPLLLGRKSVCNSSQWVGAFACAISGTGIRYLVRRYSWHTGAVFGGVSSSLSPQTLPVSGELRAPVTCIRKGGKGIAQPQPHPTRSHPTRFASFTADPTNPLSALLQNPQPSHPHYENTRQGGNTLWNRLQQVHLSHNYNHLTNLYM